MEEYFVEEKTNFDRFMDFLVFLAVFAVTIFLILEIVSSTDLTKFDIVNITTIYFYVNIVVFAIFFADLVRLWKRSDGPKDFFAHNWLDVLATIPFGLIGANTTFEILKLSRLQKLSKLSKFQRASKISKITKEFKAAAHLKKESEEYQKKHRL